MPTIQRALRMIAIGFGYVLLFLVALTTSALLQLGSPSARRIASRELNTILAPMFRGKITVQRIGKLGVTGFAGVDVQIDGPDGRMVLRATGARARLAPLRVLSSLLFAKGNFEVAAFDVRVDSLDVRLDSDAAGNLDIASSFQPQQPRPASTKRGRGFHLSLPSVGSRRIWAHGLMKGAPLIDADLVDLTATLDVAPSATTITVKDVWLTTRSMPMNANPMMDVHGRLVLPSVGDLQADANIAGTIGGIPVTANGTYHPPQLDGVVDVPQVDSSRVRALLSTAPIYQSVSLHAEAHGELSNVATTVYASVGGGSLDMNGRISAAGNLEVHERLVVKRVDLRAFSETAPSSNLGLESTVSLSQDAEGILRGHFDADFPGGEVSGQHAPPADFHGDVERRPNARQGTTSLRAHLAGRVAETGASTDLEAWLSPIQNGEDSAVDVTAHVDVPDLNALPRLGPLGKGHAWVKTNGHLRTGSMTFDASADAHVDGFAVGSVRVGAAHLVATAGGRLDAPRIQASLDARDVEVNRYKFAAVLAKTSGPFSRQRVRVTGTATNSPRFDVEGDVDLAGGARIANARAVLARGAKSVTIGARSAGVQGNEVWVEGGTIEGAGAPLSVEFRKGVGEIRVRAQSEGTDLGQLAYVTGFEDVVMAGTVALAVDVRARKTGSEGVATVTLAHGVFSNMPAANGRIALTFKERRTAGDIHVEVLDWGKLDAELHGVTIGGSGPLDARSWERAWGSLDFKGNVDLGKIVSVLPVGSTALADLSGTLSLEGRLGRDSESDDTPALDISIKTRGLALAGHRDPDQVRNGITIVGPSSWRVSGLDAELDIDADGTTGSAEVAARIVDPRGVILAVDVKSNEVPYGSLFHDRAHAADALARTPFAAAFVVPRRNLDDLPPMIKPASGGGVAEGWLDIAGTTLAPRASLYAKVRAVHFRGVSTPFDADIRGQYDGTSGDVSVEASSGDARVLLASVTANASARDAILATSAAWDASAKVTLVKFPLSAIDAAAERGVRGAASGEISLLGLHQDARLEANLDLNDLAVGSAKYSSAKITASYDGHAFDGQARFEEKGGFALIKSQVDAVWGSNLVPSRDPEGKVAASLEARKFRIAAASPFVQGFFDQLDGIVDANAKFALAPNTTELSGSVVLTDGLLEPSVLGEELHDVKGKFELTPDGHVRIDGLTASGPSGRLSMRGSARLAGLTLVDAEGAIDIPKSDPFPVALGGSSLATIYGHFDVKAASQGKALNITVDVPSLRAELPVNASHTVQPFEEAPGAYIGVFRGPRRFFLLPTEAAQEAEVAPATPGLGLTLAVHLGDDVEVRQSNTLRVVMRGGPTVKVAGTTTVRGEIQLQEGKLTVQGKSFTIEKGSVAFVGDDPSNPEVNVRAGWGAPDGTYVYADFVGPLKTGKVTLRSDPPRPNSEILSLIVSGTADGSAATPYASATPGAATQAGTFAGGMATEGLTRGLDQLTGLDISAKIDTSTVNPKPEVEVQIARDISLQLAVVLGTPPPGTNLDSVYATIAWRFFKQWSLETTVGDRGSTVGDVLWQRRY